MEANSTSGPLAGKISQKKCPHCGEWTVWQVGADDVCTHCGQLLSTHLREKEARAKRILATPTGIFPINETDGLFLKVGKRTLNYAHVAFMAVVGFVMWFITVVVS